LLATGPVLEQVIGLDADIKHTGLQVDKVKDQLAQLQKNIETFSDEKTRQEEQLESLNTQIITLQEWLTQNANDAGLGQQLPVFQQQHKALKEITEALKNAETEKTDIAGRLGKGQGLLDEVKGRYSYLKKTSRTGAAGCRFTSYHQSS
jgi:chromosome segregation ATPase